MRVLTTVVQELRDAQPECEIISHISVDRSVRCDLGRLQQEVWNAGEPIPAESLGKIFEPFWRHSVSASRNGLGLGLHICSQIVRAHAGRISVTSSPENGTQFTARLPLRSSPAVMIATRGAESRPYHSAVGTSLSASM